MKQKRSVFILVDCKQKQRLHGYPSSLVFAITYGRLRQRPDDFWIDEYELDRDNWCEGFATIWADE